eukprot:CFRG7638T1
MPSTCVVSGGYHAVGVSVPKKHFLYVRKHEVREGEETDETPAGRTLFVANIPTGYTESTVEAVFKVSGAISNVTLHKRSNQRHTNTLARELYGGNHGDDDLARFSHVVFKSAKSLEKALMIAKKDAKPTASTEGLLATGMEKWVQDCQSGTYPDVSDMNEEATIAMQRFDELQEKRKAMRQAAKNQPDDDGWVTVSYGKRANRENELAEEERLRKKKKKDMSNLYKWQQREQRRDQIADLRQKFEEDKQKIQLLKMQRKFKPY